MHVRVSVANSRLSVLRAGVREIQARNVPADLLASEVSLATGVIGPTVGEQQNFDMVVNNIGLDFLSRFRRFGALAYEHVYLPIAGSTTGGERLFVHCADAEAFALPIESALEPSTNYPVALTSGRPSIVRTIGEMKDQSAWPRGTRLDVMYLVAAAVADTDPVYSTGELDRVKETVELVGGKFFFMTVGSVEDLRAALATNPTVVVLVAHGRNDGQSIQLGGDPSDVTPLIEVASAVSECGPRIAILGVCDGASPQNFGGLATELLRKHVPIVIAARHRVEAQAFAAFAEGFLRGLGGGDDLDECVRSGRRWMSANTSNPLHQGVMSLFSSMSDLSVDTSLTASKLTQLAHHVLRYIGQNTSGLPFLSPVLLRAHSPASLLRPGTRAIPFVGRNEELDRLQVWLDESDPLSVAAIVGDGGSGKTRLAMEFVDRAAVRGWTAGFIDNSRGAEDSERLLSHPGARLVVIDYAEHSASFVTTLLQKAQGWGTKLGRVRVLLIVRQRPSRGDWLQSFRLSGQLDELLERGRVLVLELGPKTLSLDEQTDLIRKSRTAFTERLNDMGLASYDFDETTVQTGANPLTLAASVLVGLLGEAASDPFQQVIDHERRYWLQTFPGGDESLVDRVVTVTILAGIATEIRLCELLRSVPDLSDATNERRLQIARWCLSMSMDASILQPDRLAERHALETINTAPLLLANLVDAATDLEFWRCVSVVSRAASGGVVSTAITDFTTERLISWVRQVVVQTPSGGVEAERAGGRGGWGPVLSTLVDAIADLDPNIAHVAAEEIGQDLHVLNIDLAISLRIAACRVASPSDLVLRKVQLGEALAKRFGMRGNEVDLDAAFEAIKAAIELTGATDPAAFHILAYLLADRYWLHGNEADLNEAIEAVNSAIDGTDPSSLQRLRYLNNLGYRLADRYRVRGNPSDLDEALAAIKEATKHTSREDRHFATRLANLASRLGERFALTGEIADLQEAIGAISQAIEHSGGTGTYYPRKLAIKSELLEERFWWLGTRVDLEDAFIAIDEAIELTESASSDYPRYLHHLALRHLLRHDLYRDAQDLDAAFRLMDESLERTRSDNPDRPSRLTTLSRLYAWKFRCEGDRNDLDRAVVTIREAAARSDRANPEYSNTLMTAVHLLVGRFRLFGDQADYESASAVHAFMQPSGAERDAWCNGTNSYWSTRHYPTLDWLSEDILGRRGDPRDVDEALSAIQLATSTRAYDQKGRMRRLSPFGPERNG